jgi:hypothetical protein
MSWISREFKIWWTSLENYEDCPQKFLWKSGYGTIDLGRGPGRGKLIPEPRKSAHHAVMGNVLSTAMEALYNQELWRDPANLKSKLEDLVRKEFNFQLTKPKNHIIWSESKNPKWFEAEPREVLLQTCLDGILNYLHTMKRNKLLGPYARSEVDLVATVDQTPIAGRADVVIRRADTGITILDGKNSSTPGRHTNEDQLRWYALCFFLMYHEMPNRLAFVYFRYPEGKPHKDYEEDPETWTGLKDVSCTKDDLKALSHRAVQTHLAMVREDFPATPSSKACMFCDFQEVCPARIEQKAANVRKKKPKTEAEKALNSSTGIMDIGFFTDSDSKE